MISYSVTDRSFFRMATASQSVDLCVEEPSSLEFTAIELNHLRKFASKALVSEITNRSDLCVRSSFTQGCCVLADISGFTKLSHTAFSDGASGLDTFHHNVSNVFNALISVIDEFGGDGKRLMKLVTFLLS